MDCAAARQENVSMATADDQQITVVNLPELGLNLFKFLSLKERCMFLATCKYLWKQRRDFHKPVTNYRFEDCDMYARPTTITSGCVLASLEMLWSHFECLERLDLGDYATDEFLQLISGKESELIPSLREISMVESNLTDEGLEYLSRGDARAKNLESVNITFCRNTTYQGTMPLRERLVNLRVIRRQPEWMDGHFHTPFGGASDPNQVEIHTYWPDGSFSFNRDQQSRGFLCDLHVTGPGIVEDKIQFSNFSPPEGWPDFTRTCYRPGVLLKRLPDDELENGETVSSVLVAQRLRGLRPPQSIEIMRVAEDSVPLGETRYYDEDGRDTNGNARDGNYQMVSRMRVYPLDPSEGLLPPKQLLDENMAICSDLRSPHHEGMGEMLLHNVLLSGWADI